VVRAIEYEVVPRSEAAFIGVSPHVFVKSMTEIAVLRCVDDSGEKVTTVCDAQHLRHLLRSGEASEPNGMTLPRSVFPVVLPGWLTSEDAGRVLAEV